MTTQQGNTTSCKEQSGYARLAGFLFILVMIADMVGMKIVSIPAAHATQLYRIGLCVELAGSVGVVFLAMSLYVALRPVNRDLAMLALLFRLIEASGAFVMVNAFDGSPQGSAAGAPSASGTNIAAIFFSIGSAIFFYLFWKSNYIPRLLSTLGLLASVTVTFVSTGALLWPDGAEALQAGWLPIALAELLVGLWLVFKGIAKPMEGGDADAAFQPG